MENQELVKKAEDGDAEAQFRLAEKYYDKTFVFKNNKRLFDGSSNLLKAEKLTLC